MLIDPDPRGSGLLFFMFTHTCLGTECEAIILHNTTISSSGSALRSCCAHTRHTRRHRGSLVNSCNVEEREARGAGRERDRRFQPPHPRSDASVTGLLVCALMRTLHRWRGKRLRASRSCQPSHHAYTVRARQGGRPRPTIAHPCGARLNATGPPMTRIGRPASSIALHVL